MKFAKKALFLPLLIAGLFAFVLLAACNRGASNASVPELTIMMWSGDDKYYPDIGNQDLRPQDLPAQNVAAAYATAKAYKAVNPNVKINFYAKSGGDNDNEPWEQTRENFRMEYGTYPDMYAANDVINDIQRGLIADLSIFSDDPMYRSFNPQVMALMNVEGRQFAIPQYLLPWGVFINKSLAEANNIDVPDPNWNIAEFTRFVSHSRANEFYGIMGDFAYELALVNTGTRDYSYSLLNHQQGSSQFVNVNSEPVRNLLRYFAQWRPYSVWGNNDIGLVSGEFMDEHWWWGFKFFIEGKLLTLPGDPWMMGDAAHPDVANHWGAVRVADWDIYPRPATEYMPETVGIVLDPFVIRNYAMDDGNPELNEEEKAKLQIAWDFAKFWCGDSRAMEARARQLFQDGDTLKSCLNDSFPMVTGPEFQRQMDIWYIPEIHQRFKDRNKMPGFHHILDIWERGQFWDISDKCYPWSYDFEGSRRYIVHEWENAWDPEISGAFSTDPNWLDQVYSRLPNWNSAFNQRFDGEMRKLEESLTRYYRK